MTQIYTAESFRSESVFDLSIQSQNKLRSNKVSITSMPRYLGLWGKLLPLVFIAQTSLLRRSVCTKNLRQYIAVQTWHSINKSLILHNLPIQDDTTFLICQSHDCWVGLLWRFCVGWKHVLENCETRTNMAERNINVTEIMPIFCPCNK